VLSVVSETFTTHEHSLHDLFQTYLSDPRRHCFSDCNRPRHTWFTSDYVDAHHAFILIHKHDPHLFESTEGKSSVPRLGRAEVASFNEQNLSFTKNMLLFEEIGS